MYALEGIRVLDLSTHLAGPATSMYLGDQGAEVIKIEPAGSGDSTRGNNPDPFYQGNPPGFTLINRNKRGITVNLRKPEGQEIVRKLADRADVLVHNLRPAAAERAGLDYVALSKRNPRLVYASISAYGLKGPYADKGGYDRILQGLGGLMNRRLPDGMPITTGVYASDGATPMLMAYGIMLALWVREKTGRGQKVEASLLHTWLALQAGNIALAEQGPPLEHDNAAVTPGVFRCGDGAYINIAANNERQLASLACVFGLEHLVKDPSYDDPAVRARVRTKVYEVVKQRLLEGNSRDWLDRVLEADVPCGPVLDKDQVFKEPQIIESGMLTTIEHPVIGPVTMTSTPVRLSETPGGVRTPSPLLGEHTDQVLGEIGYLPEDVARLHEQGVV
jgi:CoA:oxalate CoA-transferase